ncbi:DNA repair protein RadC [Pedobacter sp. HMF7647]|uniref:DNA repair protein RadC n=1 Tax=Hufsiella arboris TaxID=2695275 RepID=A0A7K1YED3_9SPHI|nr:DNA repair protein RadC [Hufsiella arboris]MXV52942.1 DNA repair protein RadC [Hufsiella arboris]
MDQYENRISIKAWAEEDRPREKLLTLGRRAVSDAELLAILIGSGNRNETAVELSKRILHSFENDLGRLGKLSVSDLSRFNGIGDAKAITIIAALELGRRRKETEQKHVGKITRSADLHQLMSRYFEDLNHEEFWIVLTNRSHRIIGKYLISKGGQAGTIADPKIIFQTALENHAASVFLSHNHPSGNLTPSQQDIALTRKLIAAGRLFDIEVPDHLIFTNHGYYSFADEGIMSD